MTLYNMFWNIFLRYHNNSMIFIIKSHDGSIIGANKQACNFYGYTNKQFKNLNIKNLTISPKKNIMDMLTPPYEVPIKEQILKHKLFNGDIKDIKINPSPFINKKYICCVIEDITQYKFQFKQTLNYSKLLSTILNGIPDIIGLYTPNHDIVFYNKAGYDFYNKTPNDIKGKKCYHMLGRNSICSVCPTEKALKSKKVIKLEKYIPELNKYMDCCSSPVLNDYGEVEFIVEQLRDITQRKKDLNMAADIQYKSLPKEFPIKDKAHMEILYSPAKTVSGDFFNIYKISDTSAVGILADVSGKGMSAALNISALKTLFQDISAKEYKPIEILHKLNKKLIEYLSDIFIAAMCFYIDFDKSELQVAGAGLNQFIFKDSHNNFKEIIVKGPFLGMFEDSIFDECTIKFNKGDTFYFSSDGLDFLFNDESFKNKHLKNLPTNELKDYINECLNTELQQNSLKDDCTLITMNIQ